MINQSFYWRSFIASICCSSSSLRSIGTILSSNSNTSVGVGFMVLRMSIKAFLWPTSKSLWCLSVYLVHSQLMLPYSSLEGIKDVKIWTARSGRTGNSVNLLYIFLHLLVMISMWGVTVRSSSITMLSICWEETFLWGVPLIVNYMGGEARVFFLL